MKKEHGKLVFIKDLIEQVRIGIDAGVRVDKVIINFYYPGFGIEQQKQVIKDLKKIKAILNYRQDQDGFVISKPAKNALLKYLADMEAEIAPIHADKPVTGKVILHSYSSSRTDSCTETTAFTGYSVHCEMIYCIEAALFNASGA